MCGRFYINDDTAREIERTVRKVDEQLRAQRRTGDIYPTQTAGVISAVNGEMIMTAKKWGFPGFAGGKVIINSRAESVLEKRLFRESVLKRRIVVPASGYYEWNSNKEKVTFTTGYTQDRKSSILYLAGFYNYFEDGNRFVILTTAANESVKTTHDRMPLILEREEVEDWLWNDGRLEELLCKEPRALNGNVEFEQQRLPF